MSAIDLARPKRRGLSLPGWLGDSPIAPPLITSIIVWVAFSALVPLFPTMRTFSGILGAASINAVIVIGVTNLMVAGEFDLSVGAIMAMGGYFFGRTMLDGGSPAYAIVGALVITTLMGLVNGLITVYGRIPSFITTLGTRSVFRGIVWLYSGGTMLQTTAAEPVYDWLNGRLDVLNNLLPEANIRMATVWMLVLGIVFHVVLTRSRFGNHVFAVGGNEGAASALGINRRRVKIACFCITGLLSGFAGILTFSQFGSVYVATGANVDLTAIAAAVVGGAFLTGGVGSILGGLLGVLLLDTLRSGVILLGFPSDNFMAIVGVAIIGTGFLNDWIRKRWS